MGWTYKEPTFLKSNGKVDIKKECDTLYKWKDEKYDVRPVKSVVKNSVYYAAISTIDNFTNKEVISGVVCLTDVKNGWFGYKSIAETMGPIARECPLSVISLLSDTENEYALKWRDSCKKFWESGRGRLGKLPIGTTIEFEFNGSPKKYTKVPASHQFKKPYWSDGNGHYIMKKDIPNDYSIVNTKEEE